MATTILLILVLIALIYLIFIVFRNQKPIESGGEKLMFDLLEKVRVDTQNKLDRIDDRVSQNLSKSHEAIQTQFAQSSAIIKDVTRKMTELGETNKQIVSFADQMKSLENILKNPKQRGILGEYFLESLLSNVFQPSQYKMQYKFANGTIVDAAIFFNDKIVPVDAKFSLEKYNKIMEEKEESRRIVLEKEFKQDIKNRIDETAKYIDPKQDTTDFAFMFIPAEGIYYNLLIYKVGTIEINTNDLIEYAFKKHVIIVSPTSFYAYLETVLHGLKALKMEESVKEILVRVGELGKHLNAFEAHYDKIGSNLGATVNAYNNSSKEFKKIDKDVYKLSDGKQGGEMEIGLIDKPEENE
ncbi:DNA recombination protein RmuC [Candidatus Berkelbacteria bacterium CG10_big_fil_rev_8_21_14_0_10_43_13]|uniref:DNA recombination protein RmuC n=1 Tax=Candidatus Berkelbacteria bacterium CG10_big_fil_rev_8_21_14_0_10_43_13 TaxID=1974514 RepID=A0A2H0W6D4_9BACT|nr:MAG: DNA recombination protein RmuC [Candidatus Berkelbacteria bacterium CG10_big_fil_rev_8_21_14_0_10_43_13]